MDDSLKNGRRNAKHRQGPTEELDGVTTNPFVTIPSALHQFASSHKSSPTCGELVDQILMRQAFPIANLPAAFLALFDIDRNAWLFGQFQVGRAAALAVMLALLLGILLTLYFRYALVEEEAA